MSGSINEFETPQISHGRTEAVNAKDTGFDLPLYVKLTHQEYTYCSRPQPSAR